MSRTVGTAAHQDSFARRFPPEPSSVGEARSLVRELLLDAGREELVEQAVLLVSEVVTNALLHAGTPIDVSADLDDDGLTVEVGDGSAHFPVRRSYAPTARTGRGMLMLEEMVDDWGVSSSRAGKTVWFRISATRPGHPYAHEGEIPSSRGRAPGQTVTVRLLNMPLLLHGAWQEHAEALLRESLLANLEDVDDAIRMHAEATDAIAILEEHVPRANVDVDGDRLMAGAMEPRVSAPVVQLPVPVASLPHFETLNRAIETAVTMSQHGLAMTPTTQPELQQFRRWLCREVADQAAGVSPRPWSVEGEPPAQPHVELDWDAESVWRAETGRIAADEASRIIAVSPAALEIFGYDDARGLVGRRIISIIPERYRQAHVAGFTMYQLVGRQPLLGRPVVVPGLCADGSEVQVEMTVTAETAAAGRTVFLADIQRTDG